jgi:hypothetical protein
MNKFTPGPWFAFDCDVRSASVVLEGHTVAETPDAPRDSDALAESLANARLIAAAPELYEALEKVVGCADLADDEQFTIRKDDPTFKFIEALLERVSASTSGAQAETKGEK